jgi:hypothetical protein
MSGLWHRCSGAGADTGSLLFNHETWRRVQVNLAGIASKTQFINIHRILQNFGFHSTKDLYKGPELVIRNKQAGEGIEGQRDRIHWSHINQAFHIFWHGTTIMYHFPISCTISSFIWESSILIYSFPHIHSEDDPRNNANLVATVHPVHRSNSTSKYARAFPHSVTSSGSNILPIRKEISEVTTFVCNRVGEHRANGERWKYDPDRWFRIRLQVGDTENKPRISMLDLLSP